MGCVFERVVVTECKRSDVGHLNAYGYYVSKSQLVHRKTYEEHHNVTISSEQWVLHKCNNRWCIEITHLYLGTDKENKEDAVKALSYAGERNGRAKLTEQDVESIREEAKFKSHRSLGKKYGVSGRAISMIVSRETWKHVR